MYRLDGVNIVSKIYMLVKHKRGLLMEGDSRRRFIFKHEIANELISIEGSDVLAPLERHIDYVLRGLSNSLKVNGYNRVYKYIIRTKSNLTLDRESGPLHLVYDVGLSLHPIYGFPYIPASSLKGAFRHTALRYASYLDMRSGVKDVFSKLVKWVLGLDGSGISHIYFSDAYLHSKGKLFTPDILNPHYKDDVENELSVKPVPIPHIVIPKNVDFKFIMGLSNRRFSTGDDGWVLKGVESGVGAQEFTKKVSQALEGEPAIAKYLDLADNDKIVFNLDQFSRDVVEIMVEYGIGAKTSLGYSRFEILAENNLEVD